MNKIIPVSSDDAYMSLACRLAVRGKGKTRPNPMVGAVLVKQGRVIGVGYHKQFGGPHAEVVAIENAIEDPADSTLYVNLEPCAHHGRTPPCVDQILRRKIARVVIGLVDPNPKVNGKSIQILRERGIEVVCGVLESRCRRLNEVFLKHMLTGKPFVTLKAALSLDGKTACHTGASKWISGESSRKQVHRLRSSVDAIVVGIGTVLSDDPQLTVRGIGTTRYPMRVILDSRMRIPWQSRVLAQEGSVLIASTDRADKDRISEAGRRGWQVEVFPADIKGRVPLDLLLRRLGEKGVQHVLIEGGPTVHTAAIEGGIADKLQLFIAPILLGGTGAPGLLGGIGARTPSEGIVVEDMRLRRFGRDVLFEGYPAGRSSSESL